jgi:hypothetical protein
VTPQPSFSRSPADVVRHVAGRQGNAATVAEDAADTLRAQHALVRVLLDTIESLAGRMDAQSAELLEGEDLLLKLLPAKPAASPERPSRRPRLEERRPGDKNYNRDQERAERVRAELKRDPERSDHAIAVLAEVHHDVVGRIRRHEFGEKSSGKFLGKPPASEKTPGNRGGKSLPAQEVRGKS